MKISPFVALLLCSVSAFAAKPGWSENYAESLARAKEQNKLMLINFTGSDWCPACQVMDKEIFSTREFKEYAKDNLVLMEADFPLKTSQPEAIRTQNRKLQEKFGVQGFPTNFLLGPDGKPIAQFNFPNVGVKDLINKIKAMQPAPLAAKQ